MFNSIKGFFQLFRSTYQLLMYYWGYSRHNELNPVEMCGTYPLSFFANNMSTFDLMTFQNSVNNHCSNNNYYFGEINHFNDHIYNYNQFCYRPTKMKLTIQRRIVVNSNNMRIIFYLSLIVNNTILDKIECHIWSIDSFSSNDYNNTKFKMILKPSVSNQILSKRNIGLHAIIENDLSLFYDDINSWLYNQGWFN